MSAKGFLALTAVFQSLVLSSAALPLTNQSDAPPSNIHGEGESRQGWTSSPNTRGTFDILWSSVFTSFLCCWTVLCVNVAGRNDTQIDIFKRKCRLAMMTLFAPEVVAVVAVGQYCSARRSVRDFAAAGISDWTMRDAFIVDMGAFVLETNDDWVPFPIDARQLLWLVQHGYLTAIPHDKMARIRDKNKADGLVRLLTTAQAIWFTINIIGRLSQGLAITAIEVTTVTFIFVGLVITITWRHKPADVRTSETLRIDASMPEILRAGGDAAREPYRDTPLDFINRNEWAWTKCWAHFRQAIWGRMKHRRIPFDRFSNMKTPEIPWWVFRIGVLGALADFSIFLPAWNANFPTDLERLLWRISVVGCMGSLAFGDIFADWGFYIWPSIKRRWIRQHKNGENHDTASSPSPSINEARVSTNRAIGNNGVRRSQRTIWEKIRNNSTRQDPEMEVPLTVILVLWIAGIVYVVCRTYILVEVFLELRSLPLSAFRNVEWAEFLPHGA